MRILPFIVVLIVCAASAIAQTKKLPKDGNDLLDWCGDLAMMADHPSPLSSLSTDAFNEQMNKVSWCAGYLQAKMDVSMQSHITLSIIGMMNVTLSGPDKSREAAFHMLQGICIPDGVSVFQMAQVVVKWLKEHPEKLHELKNGLIDEAIGKAFPCGTPAPAKEEVKPATKEKPL